MLPCLYRKKGKDEVIKEEWQKQREQKQQLQQTKREQEDKKKEDSKKAFKKWKHDKDEKLSTTKTLYTYKEDGNKKVHEKAWCPARSIKHSYPKTKVSDTKPKKANQNQRTSESRLSTLDASYSSASFESMDGDSVCTTDSSSGDEDSVGRTGAYLSLIHI